MTPGIIVKTSKINKKGVFAARNFKKGETILSWRPKTVTKTAADKLSTAQKKYIERSKNGKYLLMQAPERFVNHSCWPNTRTARNSDIAIRNIKKGEEITSRYSRSDLAMFKCNCSDKNCRDLRK
jgi:SET domain-containing protein